MKHSQASKECSHIKACLITMLSKEGEKKFTSVRAKRAAVECRPDSWYSVSEHHADKYLQPVNI